MKWDLQRVYFYYPKSDHNIYVIRDKSAYATHCGYHSYKHEDLNEGVGHSFFSGGLPHQRIDG